MPQIDQIRDEFDIEKMIIVGDRGMISQKQIDKLKSYKKIDWITALRSSSIRKLIEDESMFEIERWFYEICSDRE